MKLSEVARERVRSAIPHAITLALLCAVAIPRVQLAAAFMDPSVDGGLYLDVADHVAHGDGLRTDLSLYHHGARAFPAPTSLYPLWPLVLGGAARLLTMDIAMRVLPLLFTLLGLAVGALAARRMFPARILGILDAGHFFILVFGLAKPSVRFLTLPYTEAIGLFITALALLRAHAFLDARDTRSAVRGGLELGLWCGLAFLVRSQLSLLPASIGGALLVHAVRERNRLALVTFASLCAGFGLTVLPWFMWVATFVAEPGFSSITSFETARHSALLSKFDAYVHHPGFVSRARAVWRGFGVAFGESRLSLWGSFSWWMYAVPLAMLAFVLRARPAQADESTAPARLTRLAFGLFAVGNVVLLHLMQKSYMSEWPFGRRHGVVYAFAIAAAVVYLASRRFPLWPVAVAVVLSLGIKDITRELRKDIWKAQTAQRRLRVTEKDRRAVATRLEQLRHVNDTGNGWLVVAAASNEPQRLAWRTDHIGYHWVHETTRDADLHALVHDLGVRYVVTKWKHTAVVRPRDGVPDHLGDHFEVMERIGRNFALWRRKEAP